jgi:hypothetical protein
MSEKMDIKLKKCQTPEFRVSFPHVFEPHAFQGQPAQYSITMLFPKNVSLKELKRAADNAATEEWGADKTKWPKNLKTPFRDGNEKPDLSGYEGTIFVAAKSKKRKPQVVGPVKDKDTGLFPELNSEAAFYAGCYARANLLAYAYSHASGNKGVGFSLQSVQKTRDGEEFSGRTNAQNDFDEVIDGSEDASSYEETDGMGF